ncbi:hypothetical protein [Ferrimicrobium sp.]|uniref:hypothetical protein n=1 Tax=Ferrimicrobium sp. TaxID=2926050 RepID=UPI00260B8F97|nr:hypothetical protein [Ferrimicrobium sp.]
MEARKRSRTAAKSAGRSLENDLVEVFRQHGLAAERLGLQGSQDKGDVRVEMAPDHIFEAKNCRTLALTQWWHEAVKECNNAQARYAWVVHKRHGVGDPAQQWITTTTGQVAHLIAELTRLRNQVVELEQRTAAGVQDSREEALADEESTPIEL